MLCREFKDSLETISGILVDNVDLVDLFGSCFEGNVDFFLIGKVELKGKEVLHLSNGDFRVGTRAASGYRVIGPFRLEGVGLASCSNGNITLVQDFLYKVVSGSCRSTSDVENSTTHGFLE